MTERLQDVSSYSMDSKLQQALHTVFQCTVVAKQTVTYAIPAWWGFTNASNGNFSRLSSTE